MILLTKTSKTAFMTTFRPVFRPSRTDIFISATQRQFRLTSASPKSTAENATSALTTPTPQKRIPSMLKQSRRTSGGSAISGTRCFTPQATLTSFTNVPLSLSKEEKPMSATFPPRKSASPGAPSPNRVRKAPTETAVLKKTLTFSAA